MLLHISHENKICSIVGDFNIDLLKVDTRDDYNTYLNVLSSNLFTPYIKQPTKPIPTTLIDNIFLNSTEFSSYSGNITIQLADHLFQFAILEGFFHDLIPKKCYIKERDFKNFNGREFLEEVDNLNVLEILNLNMSDPNRSIQNLVNGINFLLDEFAPHRKLKKHEIKLKTKPWITKEIQYLMWERASFQKISQLFQ